jgi:hypothetical protein
MHSRSPFSSSHLAPFARRMMRHRIEELEA